MKNNQPTNVTVSEEELKAIERLLKEKVSLASGLMQEPSSVAKKETVLDGD